MSGQKWGLRVTLFAAAISVNACSDDFGASKIADKSTVSTELAATADAAGNYSAAIDPNSGQTQILRASGGAVAGSAIAFPAGSLSIPVSVTIGEGETLASSSTTQQLGLGGNAASSAGPAVSFVPSSAVEASSPFTLSIPLSSTSLALADTMANNDNLIVMYKWMKVENGVTSYAIGILLRRELTVSSKGVQFQTTKFGTFQLAVTQTKITERISKPTEEPPMLRGDASNPLVGVWQTCKEPNSNSGPNPPPTGTPPPLPPQVAQRCTVPLIVAVRSINFTIANVPSHTGWAHPANSPSINLTLERRNPADLSQMLTSSISLTPPGVYYNLPVPGGISWLNHGESIKVELPPGCMFVTNSVPPQMSPVRHYVAPAQGPVGTLTYGHTFTGGSSVFPAAGHSLGDEEIYEIDSISGSHTPALSAGDIVRVYTGGSTGSFKIRVPGNETTFVNFSASAVMSISFKPVYCLPWEIPATERIECSDQILADFNANNNPPPPNNNYGPHADNIGIPPDKQLFAMETVKFSSNTFMYSKSSFDGPSCSGRMINRIEETGTYSLGAKGADGAFPIKINMGVKKGAIFPPEAVAFANQHPMEAGCGVNNWVPAVQKNLADTQCRDEDKDNTDGHGPPDAVKVEGNRILFKDEGVFDPTRGMTKQ